MGPIMGKLSSHAQNISKYENSQKKTKNSNNGIATWQEIIAKIVD